MNILTSFDKKIQENLFKLLNELESLTENEGTHSFHYTHERRLRKLDTDWILAQDWSYDEFDLEDQIELLSDIFQKKANIISSEYNAILKNFKVNNLDPLPITKLININNKLVSVYKKVIQGYINISSFEILFKDNVGILEYGIVNVANWISKFDGDYNKMFFFAPKSIPIFESQIFLKKLREFQKKVKENSIQDRDQLLSLANEFFFKYLNHSYFQTPPESRILEDAYRIAYWKKYRKNFLTRNEYNEICTAELTSLPFHKFEIDCNILLLPEYEIFNVSPLARNEFRFSKKLKESYLRYEGLEEKIVINSDAFIAYIFGAANGNNIDEDDLCDYKWSPVDTNYIDENYKTITFKLYKCFLRKLYFLDVFFDEVIRKFINQLNTPQVFKNNTQVIQYLIKYYSSIINSRKYKLKILEGIKISKEANDLFLEALIVLLQYKLHEIKGELANFIIDDDDFYEKFTEPIFTQKNDVPKEGNKEMIFYYPYKIYWNEKRHGKLINILVELNKQKTNGKSYMTITDINTLIAENFDMNGNRVPIEKTQRNLSFNGTNKSLAYSFYQLYQNYYEGNKINSVQIEQIAQLLRDNFPKRYFKKKDLSFKHLKNISSNLNKKPKRNKILFSE